MSLRVVPTTLKAAKAFVAKLHRHNKPPTGHKFSIGLESDGVLCGVAVAGRPIAHLYLATIFVGTDGSIQSSAATYLPGQRVDAGAHTAAFTTTAAVPPPPPDLE